MWTDGGPDYEQIHLPTTTTTTTTTATPAAGDEHDYYSVSSSLSPAVVNAEDIAYELLDVDTSQTPAVYDQLTTPTYLELVA